ncbi:MAG: hypothetical protein HKN12_05150 [Gemmatimonadetes bacterium]|nr:hypothetical protein [Gemmatimonadota bacterium]
MRNLLFSWLVLLSVRFLAGAAADAAPVSFEDPTLQVRIPEGWSIDGHDGEYRLWSDDEDAASLLLLLTEFDGTLEERLAEIERQFMETGLIEPEEASTVRSDGATVFYRRYRLSMGGPGAEEGHAVLLHQYSWERGGVPVLLQVESDPDREVHGPLFDLVQQSLRIRTPPELFRFRDGPEPVATDPGEGAPEAANPGADPEG